MTEFLPPNTIPEFHFFQRFSYDWQLVFYSHDETNPFSSGSEAANNRRERLARDFMNRLQRRIGLRQKEMLFFASTEFGKSEKGHLHVLISFDGLRDKGRGDKIDSSNALINAAVNETREEMFPDSLKIGCDPVGTSEQDQRAVLSYICKKEPGHEYKHCFASRFVYPVKEGKI